MFRSRRLRDVFRLGHSRKDHRRQAVRPRRGVRLMLEALEDRLTPSTMVENAPDAATLQTDLNNATAANTHYVIDLTGASSAYNLGAGQELTVSAAASGSSVSIVGSGQSITGNGNRVFSIDPGADVTLQNLRITGGSGVTKGGGVYVSGASTVSIIDSNISNNSVQNTTSAQNASGTAQGGGLYVAGSGWTVTLTGDTLSDNYAGGKGTSAEGGAAYFSAGGGSCRLTILNNLAAPIADPSIMINNYVFAGNHGNGGYPAGGALYIGGAGGAGLTANIGNTAFYGNTVAGGYDGTSEGGGVYLGGGNVTMVNCTVAGNFAVTSSNGNNGSASGGGIYDADTGTVIIDNNTIDANTVNSQFNSGRGVFVASGNPALYNNLIRENECINSYANGLDTNGIYLSNATNNSIGLLGGNAVNPAANIIGEARNNRPGGVVGVTANGNPSGGPIYYPLVGGTAPVGYGNTGVLSTIAAVEGTSPANAVDALGNLLAAHGSLDIGAVQVVLPAPPAPPHHAPPPAPPPASSPLQGIINEVESVLSSLEAEINLLLEIIESILR